MRMELNHWFISKNSLSISLMNFYANIEIIMDNNWPTYKVTVTDSNRDEIGLYFKTLEKAICFTENVVNKCTTLDEIVNSYKKEYTNDKKKKHVLTNF